MFSCVFLWFQWPSLFLNAPFRAKKIFRSPDAAAQNSGVVEASQHLAWALCSTPFLTPMWRWFPISHAFWKVENSWLYMSYEGLTPSSLLFQVDPSCSHKVCIFYEAFSSFSILIAAPISLFRFLLPLWTHLNNWNMLNCLFSACIQNLFKSLTRKSSKMIILSESTLEVLFFLFDFTVFQLNRKLILLISCHFSHQRLLGCSFSCLGRKSAFLDLLLSYCVISLNVFVIILSPCSHRADDVIVMLSSCH